MVMVVLLFAAGAIYALWVLLPSTSIHTAHPTSMSKVFPMQTKLTHSFTLKGKVFGDGNVRRNVSGRVTTSTLGFFSPELETTAANDVLSEKNQNHFVSMSPAIVELKNGNHLVVVRLAAKPNTGSKIKNRLMSNFLYSREYDQFFMPTGSGKILGIPAPVGNRDGPQDPRLFHYNGKLLVLFTMLNMLDENRRMYIYDYEDNTIVKMIVKDKISIDSTIYWEKNWCPLIFNKELNFVYNLDPLEIVQCDLKGMCSFIYQQRKTMKGLDDFHLFLRGSTPFIKYKHPYFISIAHSTSFVCDSWKKVYRSHLVIVSVEPTFRIVYLSDVLEFNQGVLNSQANVYWCVDSFLFPVSLIARSRDVYDVGMHLDDSECLVIRISGLESIIEDVIRTDSTLRTKQGPKPGDVQHFTRDIAIQECIKIQKKQGKKTIDLFNVDESKPTKHT